jgi:hypothetical protein
MVMSGNAIATRCCERASEQRAHTTSKTTEPGVAASKLSGCCLTKTLSGCNLSRLAIQTFHPAIMSDGNYLTSAVSTENKWSKNGFGEPVTRDVGKFSREESETVRSAVEEYCAMKQISTARLCSECDHKAELKGAWMEIGT